MAALDETNNNGAELANQNTAGSNTGKNGGFIEGSEETGYQIEFDKDGNMIAIN